MRIAEMGVEQFRAENYEVIIVDTSGRHKQVRPHSFHFHSTSTHAVHTQSPHASGSMSSMQGRGESETSACV